MQRDVDLEKKTVEEWGDREYVTAYKIVKRREGVLTSLFRTTYKWRPGANWAKALTIEEGKARRIKAKRTEETHQDYGLHCYPTLQAAKDAIAQPDERILKVTAHVKDMMAVGYRCSSLGFSMPNIGYKQVVVNGKAMMQPYIVGPMPQARLYDECITCHTNKEEVNWLFRKVYVSIADYYKALGRPVHKTIVATEKAKEAVKVAVSAVVGLFN